ncbi:MAG: glucan biosynthesis protein, partial [Beijerinckiaceae bacterium]
MTGSNRRTLLQAAAAAAALGLANAGPRKAMAAENGAPGLKFAAPEAFSFDRLKQTAARMAREPYVGPARPAPDIVAKIDYEAWGKIKFEINHALFANGPGRFPVSFFHLGMFFRKAVEMHVVSAGRSRQIIYDPNMFEMPEDSPARQLPKGAGFAGLRVQEARDAELDWHKNDWVAFLGADYFRAIGELHQ